MNQTHHTTPLRSNLVGRVRLLTQGALLLACVGGLGLLSACGDAGPTAEAAGNTFCAQLDESLTMTESLGDPATAGGKVADSFVQLAELAPDEIRADVQLVSDAMVTLINTPTDDPDALSDAVGVVLSPEVMAATERVGTYAIDACGIVPSALAG